tara:strand:+ start:5955 stop:6905 length:951 start_codon:yes stop_codon:yes gene_type:complete
MGATTLSSRAIIGAFFARLEQNVGSSWLDLISMLFDSDQASETYNWLGQAPVMREWVGGRNAKAFRENGLTIINKTFEATLEIAVNDIRRDKTGQIMIRINEMADRVAAHWNKLLSELLVTGESAACYDGQFFFDTDHSEGDSGTQDNDLSVDISALPVNQNGSTTAPSPEEMEQCILRAIQAIVGFVDDVGEPMNEDAQNFLVMVPTTLFSAAIAAVTNPILTSGKTNTLTNSSFNINVVANQRLNGTWTASFPVFRTDGTVKPFIRQEEEKLTISAQAEGSAAEFNNDIHQYGVKQIGNVGFGMWQHACLVTMT